MPTTETAKPPGALPMPLCESPRGAARAPQPFVVKGRAQPDYTRWSIEELRALAVQLQVPNAREKTRRELLGLLAVPHS